MSIRHVPLWFDRFPKSRRPSHPGYRGASEADVAIVGGGLTGCACAWSFAAAGVKTVLLEADRIGAGATAGATGLVREDFDASFQEIAGLHGLRTARTLWQGMRRASLDFAAAIRRLGLRCDLTSEELLHVAPRGQDSSKRFRREYKARRDGGLDHSWVTPAALARETAIGGAGAIRTRGAAIDPYRACLGLAAAAASRGAGLFEKSAVRRIRVRRKHVEIATARGTLEAKAVIVATGAPLPDLRALRRHLRPRQGYAVVTESLPAPVRRELGRREAALRDGSEPPHFLRWIKEDRVLFAGADQAPVPSRARKKVLVQRAGQLMYELSVIYPAISGAIAEWAWDFLHDGTVDGLPYIGLHRNFPRHLFALGHGRHGASTAWLAARLLLRQYLGEPARGDEAYGFVRIL
ncbi:MAG TPA: FAD-binding oxidoreductase [Vicinamibacterales bacterium]|nr:FAD-binding oxidoreductase [Vicinamibacterales bacterium]